MNEAQSICILLAIHNGQKYLLQQLDSLAQQSWQDFWILAYDDASTDDSLHILKQHILYSRCTLLPSKPKRLGAKGAFAHLLDEARKSPYTYFAFCDQDDVWHPEKLSLQLATLKNHSQEPCLVHSDMEVCDERLQMLSPSYMRHTHNHHEAGIRALKTLLSRNFASGCSMLFNRRLLECATPIPPQALMHDWWLALCAATTGQIFYLSRPLLRYRQHAQNSVGARTGFQLIRHHLCHDGLNHLRQQFLRSCLQAEGMIRHLHQQAPSVAHPAAYALLQTYAQLPRQPRWRRLLHWWRGCCRQRNSLFRMIFLFQLLLTPPQKHYENKRQPLNHQH